MPTNFPDLPKDKECFSIAEACKLCKVKTHVLRYWEDRYKPHLDSVIRRNQRRYYTRNNILTIRKIVMLQDQGLNSVGIAKALASKKKPAATMESGVDPQRLRRDLTSIAKLLES